jgi:ring-1,2-phenylacetyl-CoA epoxidase subunit PaaE
MHSIYKKVRILETIQETPDSKTFLLEMADGSELKYQAGQFITLVFPKSDGNEDRRSYSFSSAPETDATPAITIKRVQNGEYSRKLIDYAKKGDEFLTIGTSGFFVLPDNLRDYRQLFFLAAGSGITPVYSLIKTLLARHEDLEIILIYSNHSEGSTIFRRELTMMQRLHPNKLRIEFLYSTSPNLTRARLGKWLLENLLKEYGLRDPQQALFFLCGPFDYMRMATIVLQTEGVPTENIRRENFSAVKPRFHPEPPDKNPHRVDITIQGKEYSIECQYPQTILKQAKESGITLPYSCESGQCGTCAATCISGKTWMWNNEVLTDSELDKGRTLTCTAYPIDGNVVLTFDV